MRDPLALTLAYLGLFRQLGGQFIRGDATTLRQAGQGWEVDTDVVAVTVRDAVIALGPWSDAQLRRLSRRLPLGVKRGYHMHYAPRSETAFSMPIYDEAGFLVAPMLAGIRLTTGAEFALLEAPPNPAQLDSAEPLAAASYNLGARLDPKPWMGARPCKPDMKPIIGLEGRPGLWLALGRSSRPDAGCRDGAPAGRNDDRRDPFHRSSALWGF